MNSQSSFPDKAPPQPTGDIITKLRTFLYMICGLFGCMHLGSLIGYLIDARAFRRMMGVLLDPNAVGFTPMGADGAWTWLLEQASRPPPPPQETRPRCAFCAPPPALLGCRLWLIAPLQRMPRASRRLNRASRSLDYVGRAGRRRGLRERHSGPGGCNCRPSVGADPMGHP